MARAWALTLPFASWAISILVSEDVDLFDTLLGLVGYKRKPPSLGLLYVKSPSPPWLEVPKPFSVNSGSSLFSPVVLYGCLAIS